MDTKKKILLVEDDETLSTVYRSRLEMEGFDVTVVNNGEQALTVVTELMPDLMILDAMMPKVSGFDVLNGIRNSSGPVSKIKVIMLTALSQSKDRELAQSYGVDEYLVKSQVVIGDVIEKIQKHLAI